MILFFIRISFRSFWMSNNFYNLFFICLYPDYEVMVISSLAIEEQDLDLNKLNIGKEIDSTTEQMKDLLLVIEGSLTPSMMSALTNLLEYNTFVIKDDGQPVQKSRMIKVVIETSSIASLDSTISSFFKMHYCANKGTFYTCRCQI